MKRIQVTVTDDLWSLIDEQAKSIGMSLSSLCAKLIFDGINNQMLAINIMKSMTAEDMVKILNGKENTKDE